MKVLRILFLAAFLTVSSTAFGQTGPDQQSTSQIAPQGDTTSGWKIVYSNPIFGADSRAISQLQFPTRDTGYAAAYDGIRPFLLRSIDAGATWVTLDTPPPIGNIVFVTGSIGYSNYYDNSSKRWVYKTTDGGNSWTPYEIKSMLVGGGESPIAFMDADTGMIFGFSKNARTTDGGRTWTEVNPAIGLIPNAGCFGDHQTGYAVGALTPYPQHFDWPDAGYCEKSTDAGLTWKQVYTGIPHQLTACICPSRGLIVVGTSEGLAARSSDYGEHWDTTIIGVASSVLDHISFSDSLHGVIAGSLSTLRELFAVTNDGGMSWTRYDFVAPPLTGIAMLNDTVVLACAEGNIYRTTTGGFPSGVPQQPMIDLSVQIYPNPTPGASTIQYVLPSATTVSVTFTDARGVIVSSTAPQIQDAGAHTQPFDGTLLPNGVYYFTLSTAQGRSAGSITVQR